MSKTLITGASGSLGSAVVEFLSNLIPQSDIAVLIRNEDKKNMHKYREHGFDVRIGSYEDPTLLLDAFSGIDKLYFVSNSDVKQRAKQHANVVTAAKQAGVKHIFYTSSVRKDESPEAPLHPVVSGHIRTEELILESGITYTILRHNLYAEVILMFLGSRENLLETKTVYLPVKQSNTSFVPRRDLAEAEANILADATAHENKIYEFSGSEKFNFQQVAQIISDTTGEPIGFVSPSVTEFEEVLKSNRLPREAIERLSQFSQGIANGEFDSSSDDLERVLNRKTLPLSTFLKTAY